MSLSSAEEEKQIRKNFLNANLIEKGYNPEDFSNYVMQVRGLPVDSITLDSLPELIENFKINQLNEACQKNYTPQNKTKEIYDKLYTKETYDIICHKQENSPLLAMNDVVITVTAPLKVDGGFFSSSYYTFLIQCKKLNTAVRRAYYDFEWLKSKLTETYPHQYIPPLYKQTNYFTKSGDDSLSLTMRYLNTFMQSILDKKLLKGSSIVYNFITLSDDAFRKYKDTLPKFVLQPSLVNWTNMKGNLHLELNETQFKQITSLESSLNVFISQYSKLDNLFTALANDFNAAYTHMNEISTIFTFLNKEVRNLELKEHSAKVINEFDMLFKTWSSAYLKQAQMISEDFKEHFNYINMEYEQMYQHCKEVDNMRRNYEYTGEKLHMKKEQLYNSKNYSRWELGAGYEDKNAVMLLDKDKKTALGRICYSETLQLETMKKQVVFMANVVVKEWKKVKKYQNKRNGRFIEKVAGNRAELLADALMVIKLFSLKL